MLGRLYACAFALGFAVTTLPTIDWSSPLVHVAAYWVFSAVVQSLPEPATNKVYIFFYKFLNLVGSNLLHAGVVNPTVKTDGKPS